MWRLAGWTMILNAWEPPFTFPLPFLDTSSSLYLFLFALHVQIPLENFPSFFPAPDPNPCLATVSWLHREAY